MIKLRLFLSSPGDVAAERKIAREILQDLNRDPFVKDQALIEVIAWEDPSSRVLMPVSLTPQQAIDRNLAKPSETDATIVLLWGRMGTPLDSEAHGTKPDGTPYWSGTEWEYLDGVKGSAEHPQKLPIVLVYRRIDETPPPQQKDFAQLKDYLTAIESYATQLGRVEKFFEDFKGEDGTYRRNFIEYSSPEDFKRQFKQDAKLLVRELLKIYTDTSPDEDTPPTEEEAIHIEWEGSPFPGLRSFTAKDEPIFFGRGYETADLIKRLSKQRLMFVVGASGSGKSSLVAAGVIPQLNRGALYGVAAWHIVRFTPDDAPFERLAMALLSTIPALDDPLADDEERAKQLADLFQKAPDKLSKQVTKWLRDEADGTEVLLFVDQFEELYTTAPSEQRAAFVDMLQTVSPQIRVIATMRSDFYDQALVDFETVLRDASYTLSTPSRYALREMIEQPALVTGMTFDEGLPDLIVEKTVGQVGGLALVAYLLEELYTVTNERGDGLLKREDYDALGGVEKAIATRASSVYEALMIPDERKEVALRYVFSELVEPTVREGDMIATRRRALLSQFEDNADASALIQVFQEARLLVTDGGLVEVAHEALLREWDALTVWLRRIGDDLRLLRQYERDARAWDDRGRDTPAPAQEILTYFYEALSHLNVAYEDLADPLKSYTEPEQERLYRELETLPKDETSHERRRDIGDRLAVIGDTRVGVGLRSDGLPDLAWIPITEGGELEIKGTNFEIKSFYIAKYQVTYAQYQAFADADYDNPTWWDGFPERYRLQKLGGARTKIANAPRDSISWYQAVAFSRWLDAQLRQTNLLPDETMQVRLPTEWEWQWLAQNGEEKRDYPWGDWQEGYANTSEAGLSRTTAVGMYRHGEAGCGALDMSGNLSEWCLNDSGDPTIVDGFGNGENKVLRGGAFYDSRYDARASYRDRPNPNFAYHDYGVRLVVAPILRL